ncbi:MAG: hypothetical protein IKD04_07630 [Clostridia bacterium]|nr:hypothetical protein [Clostridia bacterium]
METLIEKKYEDKIINYILLALTCMNFMKSGSIVFLLFCIYNFLGVKTSLPKQSVTLFLLAFSMIPVIIFGDTEDKLNGIVKTLNYFLPFIVGYNGYLHATDKEVYVRRTLFSIFTGFSIYIILMYFYNMSLGTKGRVLYNIWDEQYVAVTLIGLMSAFIIAYSVSVIMYFKSIAIKIVCFISMLFVVLINMQTATRTPFALLVAMIVFMFFCSFNQQNYERRARYVFTAMFIFLIALSVYFLNLFGVRDAILNSPLMERFLEKGMETSRVDITKFYFQNMLKYPWGGGNVHELYGTGAHNIWQQCYDTYGVFAAFFMLIITISMIKYFIKLLLMKDKQDMDYVFIAVYLGVLIQIGLEPVMTGYPILFWVMLFIHGMAYLRYSPEEQEAAKPEFIY